MNLILFGPPGAGKGTQSALLIERLGLKHISTGDLFRAAIKNQTELGVKAKAFLDSGKLVPDEITIGLVKEVLSGLSGQGFILDGFPRTVVQADALEKMLLDIALKVDCCVFIDVPNEYLLKRLTGRRVCTNCGTTYHNETKPTKVAGKCDLCGSPVEQRKDDHESVIVNRLNAYVESTRPLKEYYKNAGMMVEVDGIGSESEVYNRMVSAIGNKSVSH